MLEHIDINAQIDTGIQYLLSHYGYIFDFIAKIVDQATGGVESTLLFLSPWGLVGLSVALAWWRVGKGFALFTLLATLFIVYSGFLEQAITTLALTLSATLFSILFGIPLGVLTTRQRWLGVTIRPALDFMQTMPAFVYLIPATILFGLGRPPGIFATVLFAMPPVVRLTDLGLRHVDQSLLEAARTLGAKSGQVLWRIELPSAIPSIMMGINQTIMMAMSMVIIAAMVGAGGLGNDILTSIQQLNIGLGLQSGTVVVVMAILLDRLSASFATDYDKISH